MRADSNDVTLGWSLYQPHPIAQGTNAACIWARSSSFRPSLTVPCGSYWQMRVWLVVWCKVSVNGLVLTVHPVAVTVTVCGV